MPTQDLPLLPSKQHFQSVCVSGIFFIFFFFPEKCLCPRIKAGAVLGTGRKGRWIMFLSYTPPLGGLRGAGVCYLAFWREDLHVLLN